MVIIVGAGPAGLSAAYHLKTDYTLLEKENEIGGLCRSFDLAGVTFDLGGHAFFTKHTYVKDLVQRLCTVGLFQQPRQAWVYSHDTYIPYPFQSNLFGLPLEVIEDCLVGLYEAVATCTDDLPHNLQDWIDRSFGKGVARHFLSPYNEKIWAYPLDDIAPLWTGQRIVTPNIRAIIAGTLRRVDFRDFPNANVIYPAEGGFFNLYSGLATNAKDHLHTGEVSKVHLSAHYLETTDGQRFDYDYLISTMPLTDLIDAAVDAPDTCRQAASHLHHNSLYLVNFVFERSEITEMQRIYVADHHVPFHKLVINSNSSQSLRQLPHFGIQAEVSFSPYKHVDPDNLMELVFNSMIQIGIINANERVIASNIKVVPLAYPVYGHQWSSSRQHILEEMKRNDIFCAGRFGEWLYINSDDAVMRGKAAADAINELTQ